MGAPAKPRLALPTVLTLAGLLLSGYLGFLHVALLRGDVLGGPLCGGLGSVWNCHAVSASALGRWLGIPLAFWGVLGYVATLALVLIAWQARDQAGPALTLAAWLNILAVIIDAGLLGAMVVQLRVLCALCLMTYAINAALVVAAVRAGGRLWPCRLQEAASAWRVLIPRSGTAAPVIFWGIVVTAAVGLVTVHASVEYLSQVPGGLRERMRRHVREAPRVSVETAGSPRLGPEGAPIQIVQFTDFLCPLCREAARFNDIILSAHRGQVSLVVKQFPLDQSCNGAIDRNPHPGACDLAAAAVCAGAQGKFWAFHDQAFRSSRRSEVSAERIARQLGLDLDRFRACLAGGEGMAVVKQDIAAASRLGIAGTPTAVINGILVRGATTPAQFDELIRALLAHDQAEPTQ